MTSVGHVAVGVAAARLYHNGRTATPPRPERASGTPAPRWSSRAFWSALSLLPDADVIGFALGVDYGDPWGHRGATHSLALSVAFGLAIGLSARWFKRPAVRTALFASAVLASHAVLDTMTDGGLGCALLWPFDLARYFTPWRPIPVAPIGQDFFSPSGAVVALTELVLPNRHGPCFRASRDPEGRESCDTLSSNEGETVPSDGTRQAVSHPDRTLRAFTRSS